LVAVPITALIGDLDERYREHQSGMWYCKQALIALIVSFFNEAWRHKSLAVGVMVLNFISMIVKKSSVGRLGGITDTSRFRKIKKVPTECS
jgi:uncharacterized membrane protein YoaK (UPF0700 family)